MKSTGHHWSSGTCKSTHDEIQSRSCWNAYHEKDKIQGFVKIWRKLNLVVGGNINYIDIIESTRKTPQKHFFKKRVYHIV